MMMMISANSAKGTMGSTSIVDVAAHSKSCGFGTKQYYIAPRVEKLAKLFLVQMFGLGAALRRAAEAPTARRQPHLQCTFGKYLFFRFAYCF